MLSGTSSSEIFLFYMHWAFTIESNGFYLLRPVVRAWKPKHLEIQNWRLSLDIPTNHRQI